MLARKNWGRVFSLFAIIPVLSHSIPFPVQHIGTSALFVWDSSIPGNELETNRLLQFAASRGINTLFLEASPVGYEQAGSIPRFTGFVDAARGAGIAVYALSGYPWWTTACGDGIPGQDSCFEEGWSVYQNIASSGIPFEGIVDDSEPYLANEADWWSRPAERAQDYLDYLRGIRSRIGGMIFQTTIPFWYDEDARLLLSLDGEANSHPLNWYASRIVDRVVVMDYRDRARGQDGILSHIQGEAQTGPFLLAVETNCGLEDKITFCEEGSAAMKSEMQTVSRRLRSQPNFRGFAIHDYFGLENLPE